MKYAGSDATLEIVEGQPRQSRTLHRIPLRPGTTLRLKLDGTLILDSSDSDTLTVEAIGTIQGGIVGFATTSTWPPYRLTIDQSRSDEGAAVVRVSPEPRSTRTHHVGLYTVRETHWHRVLVPEGVQVKIHASELDLEAVGHFEELLVDANTGQLSIAVAPRALRYLFAQSREGLITVDGNEVGRRHEMSGDGSAIVRILTDRGRIKFSSN